MREDRPKTDQNLFNHEVQTEFFPDRSEDLEIFRSRKQVTIFYKKFCYFTYKVSDLFSRNYCIIQLHLSGGISLKKLCEFFGLSHQHCSNIVSKFKRYGVRGLIENTSKRFSNRKVINKEIGASILSLRARGVLYVEISEIIRFRFRKKIRPQSIRAWISQRNNLNKVSNLEEQLDFYEVSEPSEELSNEWHWNSYAGSMILYGMIEWSGFLKTFEEFIVKDNEPKSSAWGVRQVLLTVFFLHALRCKSIEQGKHLVGEDFREIIGGDFLRTQWLRYAIDEIVNHPSFDRALDAYYKDLINLTDIGDDIYYTDGHFSNYYGGRKVPKGYDPRRQMGFRGRNTIYLHNTRGENIYFFESPANTSLSNDIEKLVEEIESLGMELPGKTLIFDRGGYSQKCFKFLKIKKMFFITYLKNRKKERLISEDKFEECIVNTEEGDEVIYKIHEKEKRETKCGKVRIVVFLVDDGRQIPIITNNPLLKKESIVFILQRRWREENCFKYMSEHFNIDLLTTYKTSVAPDKIITRVNPARKKVNKEIKDKQNELSRLQKELAEKITVKINQDQKTIKEFLEEEKELNFAIKNVEVDIDYLKRQREKIKTKVKINLKDEHVIIAQKRRLLINSIKVMNYNAEKWLQIMFKKYHAKTDETLSLIRSLWHHPGRIRIHSRKVEVELKPLDSLKMKATLGKVLKKLKENNDLRLPDGRHLHITQA